MSARREGASPESVVVFVAPKNAVSVVRSVLSGFADDFPAAMIVLLQPGDGKERPLAQNLNRRSSLLVTQGAKGTPVRNGRVTVVLGDHSLALGADGSLIAAYGNVADDDAILFEDRSEAMDETTRSEPLIASLAIRYGRGAVAVALTGLDGSEAEGFRRVRANGGLTIALDESERLWEIRSQPATSNIRPHADDEFLLPKTIGARIRTMLDQSRGIAAL